MRITALRIVHALWGLPQTVMGAALALVFRKGGAESFRMARITHWQRDAGLSLGLFVFLPQGAPRRLLVHEYGHSIQSLVLGPLYLPIVVVPSLVWAGVPALASWRRKRKVSYYSFYTERWANAWAERVCHERAMR